MKDIISTNDYYEFYTICIRVTSYRMLHRILKTNVPELSPRIAFVDKFILKATMFILSTCLFLFPQIIKQSNKIPKAEEAEEEVDERNNYYGNDQSLCQLYFSLDKS